MSMTWGEFRRWVAEMEPLRAESMLDAAQAASVPHMGEAARGWYDRMQERVAGWIVDDAPEEATGTASGFVFNGNAVSFDALYHQLAGALGGGVAQ